MSSIYELIQKIVLAGIIALSIGIIAAIKLSRSITKPIENLCDATEKIAAGDFNIKVNTKSKDEVGFLANSFEKMSKKLQSLLKEQVEKVRLENELNIAATVQKTLLPENNLNNDVLYMNSFYASAAECGGDIWHYFVKNNKLVIMIADATGHGLGSAFVTVSARTVFSMIKQMAETNEEILNHPSYMITQANGAVYDVAKGGIMMTLFLGILDLETGQLVYVNAGHNPPWILKNGSKTEACAAPGLRLGENQNVPDYLAKTTHMNPGDMLFLYTDGITEGTDSQAQQFGKKTVRKILESNIGLGPEKAFNSLITEFNEFSKGKSFDDDVTAVIIQLKKYKIQGAA